MAYITRSWHNHWALLEQLINEDELDIVLPTMALSWMSEEEYLRLEVLVGEAEWIASLQDRAVVLPELPLDFNSFFSFLDVKVGGFIASNSWGISLDSMTSTT